MHWSAQRALLRLAKQRSRCGDLMAMCVMAVGPHLTQSAWQVAG